VITVTMENAPILGKLELRKQSTYGKPMQGVEFLLEFSLDGGQTWTAVTKRENDTVITPGSCTSADLNDGTLVTNADGIAIFDGLRVYTADGNLILYRVTETKTLNGSTLMPGPIWEGDLLTEKEGDGQFEVVLGVANSPILELPETGSNALSLMPIGLLLCAAVCMGAMIVLKKKEV
jgi:LPXTG-motif cell wall-anchored protein